MFSRSVAVSVRLGHRVQPDVGVEADLVRGMAGEHRAAARLRDVADQKARPAVLLGCVARQFLDQRDHRRVAPAAVARQAHGLPGRPVGRNGDAAGEAALRVEAVGLRRHCGRQRLVPEQVLGEFLRARPRRLDARHGKRRNRNRRKLQRGSEEDLHGLSQLFLRPDPGPRWLPNRKRRPPCSNHNTFARGLRSQAITRASSGCAHRLRLRPSSFAAAHMASKAER